LNQRERFVQFIERSQSARQHDKTVRVFEQQHLANEEVVAGNPAIEVRVGRLFERQFDVAPDRQAARIVRAAIGGFHQARTAAGHHGKPHSAEPATHLARQFVVLVAFLEAGGAEHGDARSDEMQVTKSIQEVARGAQQEHRLAHAGVGPLKEQSFGLGVVFGCHGYRRWSVHWSPSRS
jgi:hypothetical protein